MADKKILEEIRKAAEQNRKRLTDPRYLRVMGFLIAKGFLGTNQKIRPLPNVRIDFQEAIWAGTQVEPRILEVLPAAILRMPIHFHLTPADIGKVTPVLQALKVAELEGPNFFEVPYTKYKQWRDYKIPDGRHKVLSEKKTPVSYRLSRESVQTLKTQAMKLNISVTDLLEKLILGQIVKI